MSDLNGVKSWCVESGVCVYVLPDLFGECYSNSEDRAYALLVRRTRCWNQSTVLNLATEADAKCFFAHNGVQVGTQRHTETDMWPPYF